MVDVSGDTPLTTTAVGLAPYYLATDALTTTSNVSNGYTLNGDGTFNNFDISPLLIASAVLSATLSPGGASNSVVSFSGTSTSNVYVTQPARSSVAQFLRSGTGLTQVQELTVPANPIYTVGVPSAPRVYTISQGTAGGTGFATAIETATAINTISNTIPVGSNPVYGVMTADARRAFVLNQGDGTVTVINAQQNQLDTPINTIAVGTAPVWADLIPTRNEIAVLNAGNGTTPGSLTLISIPLCSVLSAPTNPNCDPNNPIDAVGFGTVLATIPVGVRPNIVAVLQDGTQAFVANSGDTVTCPASFNNVTPSIPPANGCGTVSVINLLTNTVVATIPVAGHPNFLAATTGSPTGKVYTTSSETSLLTILRTDTDNIQTYVDLQGTGQQVRMTAQ